MTKGLCGVCKKAVDAKVIFRELLSLMPGDLGSVRVEFTRGDAWVAREPLLP